MQRILQLFSRALRLSLVVGLLCCTAATARAQGGGEPITLNATLTVTLTERPATAVLDEITRKTGIKFAYDPEDIRRLPAVSGEFKKVTVHELLDKCIAGSTFKYAIENNVVLVYDSTVKMRKFTVSGTVRDAGKTVLPGASVILKGGSGQGVSTDEKGQFTFSFSTKTSPAVLEVGFLGMETQQVIITGSAKGLNVTLKEGGTRIDDVVVNGMFTRNKSTYTGSVTSIKGEDLVAISNTNLMSALSAVTPGMVVVQNNALGKRGHAEVVGLTGQVADPTIVIEREEDLELIDFSRQVYFLSQTTQSIGLFERLGAEMRRRAADAGQVYIDDTICRQVSNREQHLTEFSGRFDAVVFVCGRKSSNGKVLSEVCRRANPRTHVVEEASEIDPAWFEGAATVGICGATSTPKWLMQDVADAIGNLNSEFRIQNS